MDGGVWFQRCRLEGVGRGGPVGGGELGGGGRLYGVLFSLSHRFMGGVA